MKVSVNIKVRNSEWYRTEEEKEEPQEGVMSLKEWQMINEDKIPKHSRAVAFEFTFEVEIATDNRDTSYDLEVFVPAAGDKDFKNPVKHIIKLENMTVVEFSGEGQKGYAVVANELIYQYMGAQKSGKRYYWYFYLHENAEYVEILNNIWITQKQFDSIASQFERFSFRRDTNLKIRSETLMM